MHIPFWSPWSFFLPSQRYLNNCLFLAHLYCLPTCPPGRRPFQLSGCSSLSVMPYLHCEITSLTLLHGSKLSNSPFFSRKGCRWTNYFFWKSNVTYKMRMNKADTWWLSITSWHYLDFPAGKQKHRNEVSKILKTIRDLYFLRYLSWVSSPMLLAYTACHKTLHKFILNSFTCAGNSSRTCTLFS